MNFSQISSQLPKLIQKQNKNEIDLSHKIEPEIKSLPIGTNLAPFKTLYDSDWQDVTPKDINGSASQVENLELPQRVPFEFTTNLEVPEVYLPFIDIALLTKPIDDQKVIGAGEFVYSGLQEVLLRLYRWMGITEELAPAPSVVEYSDGSSLPTKPTPTIPLPTYASDCYERTSFFTTVNIVAGTTLTVYLSPDGMTTRYPSPPGSSSDLIASFLDTYGDEEGKGTLTWNFGQSIEFKYQQIHFPVPIDGKAVVPCGSTVNPHPENYYDQYWEEEGIDTFQQYLNLGYTYTQAKTLFTSLYSDIFITPESHGYPYKAYKRINSNVVESGDLKTKIVKTGNDKFQFSVYGTVLLVSPAITETDYSDPEFPTFKPDANPLSIRLLISFKDHPVNFTQTRMYRQ